MSHAFARRLALIDPVARSGRVTKIMPTHVEADGPNVPLGALCTIESGDAPVIAAVARVDRSTISLVPFEDVPRTFAGARVLAHSDDDCVPVGDAFLGRACTEATSASQESTGLPSAATTRSPGCRPARSAAPPRTSCPITASSGGR